MSKSIRASVAAIRMLRARGLSSAQVSDALAGYSLGCIILRSETVASHYRKAQEQGFWSDLFSVAFGEPIGAERRVTCNIP